MVTKIRKRDSSSLGFLITFASSLLWLWNLKWQILPWSTFANQMRQSLSRSNVQSMVTWKYFCYLQNPNLMSTSSITSINIRYYDGIDLSNNKLGHANINMSPSNTHQVSTFKWYYQFDTQVRFLLDTNRALIVESTTHSPIYCSKTGYDLPCEGVYNLIIGTKVNQDIRFVCKLIICKMMMIVLCAIDTCTNLQIKIELEEYDGNPNVTSILRSHNVIQTSLEMWIIHTCACSEQEMHSTSKIEFYHFYRRMRKQIHMYIHSESVEIMHKSTFVLNLVWPLKV